MILSFDGIVTRTRAESRQNCLGVRAGVSVNLTFEKVEKTSHIKALFEDRKRTSPRDLRKSWVFTDPIEGYLRTERLSGAAVLPILPQEGTSFPAAPAKKRVVRSASRSGQVLRAIRSIKGATLAIRFLALEFSTTAGAGWTGSASTGCAGDHYLQPLGAF